MAEQSTAAEQAGGSDLHADQGALPAMPQPLSTTYESYQPPPQRVPASRLIGLTATMVALIIFGIGWNMSRGGEQSGGREESVFTEQQRTMREATEKARQVQQGERERVEEMVGVMEGE